MVVVAKLFYLQHKPEFVLQFPVDRGTRQKVEVVSDLLLKVWVLSLLFAVLQSLSKAINKFCHLSPFVLKGIRSSFLDLLLYDRADLFFLVGVVLLQKLVVLLRVLVLVHVPLLEELLVFLFNVIHDRLGFIHADSDQSLVELGQVLLEAGAKLVNVQC